MKLNGGRHGRIATAATEQVGNEGAIVGVIVMLYAHVFPHLVPHDLTFVK